MEPHHCLCFSPGLIVFLISFDVLTPDTSSFCHPHCQPISCRHPRISWHWPLNVNCYWLFIWPKRFKCRFMQYPFDANIISGRNQRALNSIKKGILFIRSGIPNIHPFIHYHWQITINDTEAAEKLWEI